MSGYSLEMKGRMFRSGVMFGVITIFTAGVSAASAQSYDPQRTLGRVDGLSNLQQRTGDAVQAVCGAFIANGVDMTRSDVAQQTILFDKCGEMVTTARVLTGEEGGTGGNLGINAEALGSALQNVSVEEIAAAGSLATESAMGQSQVIGKRLATVLSQSSTLQLSSANFRGDGSLLLASTVGGNAVSGGGAASADDPVLAHPLGIYINALGAFAEKVTTEGEDGFEAATSGISLGVDYLFSNNTLAGLNLAFSSTTTEFDLTDDVTGGDMNSDQTNVSAYGMWFNEVGYVDVLAGFGTGSYDFSRRILITSNPEISGNPDNDGLDDTVVADTDSDSFRFGIGGGMELRAGAIGFSPYARLSYLSADLDGYEERGGSALKMRVESQSIDSLTGGFGFRLSGTYSGTKAIVSPQFSAELVREFSDDSRQIVSSYVHDPRNNQLVIVTDRPDRSYYTMGMSVSAVFQSGFQLFAEVQSLLDLDSLNEFSVTTGFRIEL
ncbi:MAG: autotransporter outer membrane beta-barrel domain-containing protein [Granulosicoccus sp.]